MADFSQVPEDILAKIVGQHLDTAFADHIAFAGVCRSWRSAALLPHNRCRRGSPGILMSPKLRGRGGARDVTATTTIPRCCPPHRFFPDLERTPSDPREENSVAASASFANIGTGHCVGSSDGWLVLVRPRRRFISIYLLNPLTGETVDLPPLRLDAGFGSIHKAVLSSSPKDDDDDKGCYLFVFSYSSPQLVWCNVAGGRGGGWKFAGGHMDSRVFQGVPDAASYSDGKLYVVAGDCVYVLNITQDDGSTMRALIQFSPAMKSPCYETRTSPNMCHIDGQLHVILLRRVRGESDGTTFHVYKLLQKNDGDRYKHDGGGRNYYSWEKVRSLNGHAVFLGTHQCFSLPAMPNDVGVQKNCIYFALNGCQLDNSDAAAAASDMISVDDGYWIWCRYDCGVFNVGDGTNQWVADTHGGYNCVWFFPMPWNISKHKIQSGMRVRDGRLLEGKEDHRSGGRRPRRPVR